MKHLGITAAIVAFLGYSALGQVGSQLRFMFADTNGVVMVPTNVWAANREGIFTGLDLSISINSGVPNGTGTRVHWSRLTGVPSGFADGTDDGGGVGGGSGTVTNVGASTSLSGLGFSGSPVTYGGTLSLTGVVAIASGGTGATDATGARSNLGVLSSRWLTGFGSPADYSQGVGSYYVNLETYQVWQQTGASTWETIPFFVMGEGVYSYLDRVNLFSNTNSFYGPIFAYAGIAGNGSSLTNLNGGAIQAGGFTSTNIFLPNRNRVLLFSKECLVGSAVVAGNMLNPELSGVVSSSATSVALLSEPSHPGLIRLSSSSSANSSYGHYTGNAVFRAEVGLTWHSITRVQNTNAGVRFQWAFSDSTTGPNPVDAMRMWQSNNLLIPQIYSNSALVQGYEYPVASNQWLRILVSVLSTNTVRFAAVDSSNGTLIVDTNLVGTLPDTSARLFGIGLGGIYTNAAASPLADIDLVEAWYDIPVTR